MCWPLVDGGPQLYMRTSTRLDGRNELLHGSAPLCSFMLLWSCVTGVSSERASDASRHGTGHDVGDPGRIVGGALRAVVHAVPSLVLRSVRSQ